MKSNASNHRQDSPRDRRHSASIPELKILRPDGSWKPIAACVATPEQFEGALSPETLERFIVRAKQSKLAMEGVIAAIRQNWNH